MPSLDTPQNYTVSSQSVEMPDGKFSKKYDTIAPLALKYKPRRLLEIGCGEGRLAIFFATRGIEVTGIDLRESSLSKADSVAKLTGVNVSFLIMDACDISITGFDIATSTDFYEHLTEEQQSWHLASVYNALAPGGIYLLRTPHKNNVRQQNSPEHIGLVTYTQLKAQALASGFTPYFCLPHTTLHAPFQYQLVLERFLDGLQWAELTKYKILQKFGMANVLAVLKKTI